VEAGDSIDVATGHEHKGPPDEARWIRCRSLGAAGAACVSCHRTASWGNSVLDVGAEENRMLNVAAQRA